jgi:thiazole synthase ThiGH ThiG subunit
MVITTKDLTENQITQNVRSAPKSTIVTIHLLRTNVKREGFDNLTSVPRNARSFFNTAVTTTRRSMVEPNQ